ncbi:MAG: hypothetical protein J7K32_03710, partial [Deltaproteobacteria bacterium]|nr:hypothetical protein [Deltaproteobacteria bacterium]
DQHILYIWGLREILFEISQYPEKRFVFAPLLFLYCTKKATILKCTTDSTGSFSFFSLYIEEKLNIIKSSLR